VVDVGADRTLANSGRAEDLVILDEQGVRTHPESGVDVSRPRRLNMRTAVAVRTSDHASLVIRMWGPDGRSLAIVPVVAVYR
jgi:hypothetical protein